MTVAGAAVKAQVPQIINYQGRVSAVGALFTGTAQFSFALVSPGGTSSYWSNDGTSTGGSQPTASVSVLVNQGLYSILLGDTNIAGMTAIPTTVFSNADVRLRIWFDDGVHGSELLTPDQRIASVGYAQMAAAVAPGSVGLQSLAPRQTGTSVGLGGVAISANSGSWSQTGIQSGNVQIPGLVASITTSGRPVIVSLIAASGLSYIGMNSNDTPGNFALYRDGQAIVSFVLQGTGETYVPPGSVFSIDIPPPGTHVYTIRADTQGYSSATILVNNVQLAAWEF
jgi:hypothetical protein